MNPSGTVSDSSEAGSSDIIAAWSKSGGGVSRSLIPAALSSTFARPNPRHYRLRIICLPACRPRRRLIACVPARDMHTRQDRLSIYAQIPCLYRLMMRGRRRAFSWDVVVVFVVVALWTVKVKVHVSYDPSAVGCALLGCSCSRGGRGRDANANPIPSLSDVFWLLPT